MKRITFSLIGLFIVSLTVLAACSAQTDFNQQTANHIARPAFMSERFINTGNFEIKAWERMHKHHAAATIYIEGNGNFNAHAERSNLDFNNTPENPVALHLASRDLSKNLGYLGRPCQYIKSPKSKGCDPKFWRTDRYTPEVIEAYEAALNNIAATYDITGFHLVGYDGGANIAAVLAARNKNVLSLRTVAGILNPDLVADQHTLPALASNSMMALDYGSKLSDIPQIHYIGEDEAYVTPNIYHSYRQQLGMSDCIYYALVPDAKHTRGWVEQWPELLKVKPQCATVHKDLPPLPPPPADIPDTNFHKGMKSSGKSFSK